MKGDKVFLDTNLLLYAYDAGSPVKHAVAVRILEDLWKSGNGILSTQILQESSTSRCGTDLIQASSRNPTALFDQEGPLPGAFVFWVPAARTYFGQSPTRCATSSSFDAWPSVTTSTSIL